MSSPSEEDLSTHKNKCIKDYSTLRQSSNGAHKSALLDKQESVS